MPESLLPQRFLFRFSLPCQYHDPIWTDDGAGLDASHCLTSLAELESRAAPAEVRAAWSEAGVAFSVRAAGKKQPAWCRESRPEESDGMHVWIDTRDVHTIHRAGRFCHQFAFLPGGAGSKFAQPVASWLPIHRAREHPRAIELSRLKVRSEKRIDGYLLEFFIPAVVLTGFDPAEHPRLGFTYALIDRELGEQTLAVGSPMPFQEDPSLWATLQLAAK